MLKIKTLNPRSTKDRKTVNDCNVLFRELALAYINGEIDEFTYKVEKEHLKIMNESFAQKQTEYDRWKEPKGPEWNRTSVWNIKIKRGNN